MIAQELKTATGLTHVEVHARLGSTNDYAKRLAESGQLEPPGLILAEAQTSGRGQRASSWHSDADSLTVTFFFSLGPTANSDSTDESGASLPPGLIPLVVADCLADSITSMHPRLRPTIKWPNDVLVDGRKVAGVLVEKVSLGPGAALAIIGVGVNVNQPTVSLPASKIHGPESPMAATSLREALGCPSDRRALLIQLALRLKDAFDGSVVDPGQRLAGYSEKLSYLDQKISIQQANKSITFGRLVGVSSQGAAIIDTADGEKLFHSGSIRPSE